MKGLYKYIFSFILGTTLLSCTDDALTDKGGESLPEGDTPYYLKLKLVTKNDSFTRSEGDEAATDGTSNSYIDGEHYEHDITAKAHNFALFFDAEEKYITYADLYSVNEEEKVEGDHGAETSPVPVEATYSARFYGFANRKPAYVMAVVNANEKIYNQLTNFPGWDIEEVMKQIWEEKGTMHYFNNKASYEDDDPYDNMGFCIIDDKAYFTMTNSSYVYDGKVHCAQEIGNNITTDLNEIDKIDPVLVYLERMVSKFSLNLSFDENMYVPINVPSLDVCMYNEEADKSFVYYDYPWAIKILAWGMNGLETQNYIFKNLDASGDWLSHIGWNAPNDKRSFWAIDPHYTKDESDDPRYVYPWQFDDAKDKYDLNPTHKTWYEHFHYYGDESRNFPLVYYPFTRFCPDINNDGTVNNTFNYKGGNQIIYTPENSFIPGMQVDRSRGTRAYELAGTHIIVCAQLQLDENGGTDFKPFDGNIYRNRVGITYIDELSLFEDFLNAVNYKITSQKYLYYKYYPWNDAAVSNLKNENNFGETFRAVTGGQYALFYRNQYEDENKYYELTPSKLRELIADGNTYRLIREADAINADGKIIPWIMYNPNHDGEEINFKPLDLYFIKKADENYPPGKFQSTTYNEKEGEIIDLSLKGDSYEYNFTYFEEETDDIERKEIDVHVDAATYLKNRKIKIQYLPDFNMNDKWEDSADDFMEDNDIQSIFFEIWGVADCYNHGLMYYAIPIYSQEQNSLPAFGPERQLADMSAGLNDPSFYYYYGVIRNNWYNFTLHSVSDLGYPVSNPNKPIVPNYINKKDQVKVEMEILPMHIQDIFIDGN